MVRVGPGRIRIGPSKYTHWFDGDGQVTLVTLDGKTQSVRIGTRMVRTKRVEAQEVRLCFSDWRGVEHRAVQWSKAQLMIQLFHHKLGEFCRKLFCVRSWPLSVHSWVSELV